MRKYIYILAIIIYIIIGVAGIFSYAYVEMASLNNILVGYLWLMIIISLGFAMAYFYYFLKFFPKAYQKQKNIAKIFIPVAIVIMTFVLNRYAVLVINDIYGKSSVTIHGKVIDKYFERHAKGSKSYYLKILDATTKVEYILRTSKVVFDFGENEGDYFNKTFRVGWLGIAYRRNL